MEAMEAMEAMSAMGAIIAGHAKRGGLMFFLLGMVAVWTAAIVGYTKTRSFVRERLRYVDAVHKAFVPLKVGVIAAAVTLPIAWIVPFVPAGAALLFGTSIGWGVASGRKDIRNRRYLASSYQ